LDKKVEVISMQDKVCDIILIGIVVGFLLYSGYVFYVLKTI